MVTQTSLGKGTISLTGLQLGRKAAVSDMNVVSLNLGSEGHPGSIVFGGYDENLIDVGQSAVFEKRPDESKGSFKVFLGRVAVGEEEVVTFGEKLEIALAYDSIGLRLPQETIDEILPAIGNPRYDQGVQGYVYSGEPPEKSLAVTLSNGTADVHVTLPLSSLMFTESIEDNPLTTRKENGTTYLPLQPTPPDAKSYLGRGFLQHVYLVNSPAKIQKFHLNALPSDLPTDQSLIAASPSANNIFNGVISVPDGGPRVGLMVGAIVGGIAVLLGCIGIYWFIIRRRRKQTTDAAAYHFSDGDNIHSYHPFDKEGHGNGFIAGAPPMSPGYPLSPGYPMSPGGYPMSPGLSDVSSEHTSTVSKKASVRTTHSIPISYSPSPFEKELGDRFSQILPPSRIRSQPIVELPPAARHTSHRSNRSHASHSSNRSHPPHSSHSPRSNNFPASSAARSTAVSNHS